MNDIDIDALSGRELDIAVALELGWRWMVLTHNPTDPYISLIASSSFRTFAPYGHFSTAEELASDLDKSEGSCPHYSADIAAAWELDGEGWSWQAWEGEGYTTVRVITAPKEILKKEDYFGHAKIEQSKSVAYATARCRAWLKAKYAERVAEVQ